MTTKSHTPRHTIAKLSKINDKNIWVSREYKYKYTIHIRLRNILFSKKESVEFTTTKLMLPKS